MTASAPSLLVRIDERPAGTIDKTRNGALRLRYDDDYRRSDPTPLSLSLPTSAAEHVDPAAGTGPVEAYLRGLLPDNPRVVERWARASGVRTDDVIGLLGDHRGEDLPGSVQLVAPHNLDAALDPGELLVCQEAEIEQRLEALAADGSAWQTSDGLARGRWSLAGAQPKLALRQLADGRWADASGREPTTHILKPPPLERPDHDINEHLCLEALRRAGLPAARTEVVAFGAQRCLVVDRFDRTHADSVQRIHQEDLCQALGVPPEQKYESMGGPTAAAVVGRYRRAMPRSIADGASRRLVGALAASWLLVAPDGHAKNLAVLLSGREVRDAPLYDVASYVPELRGTGPEHERVAMGIAGEDRLGAVTGAHWRALAGQLRLDDEEVVRIVADLADRLPDALADAAGALRWTGSDLPDVLVSGVAAWCRWAHAALDRH